MDASAGAGASAYSGGTEATSTGLAGAGPDPSTTSGIDRWRACIADDDVRRDGVGIDYDDRQWPAAAVPGHWRSIPELNEATGPVMYRADLRHRAPQPGERVFVVFDGVMYQADVWLDGAYLGDPEGYIAPHAFDITDLARLSDDHVLAVELACPTPSAGAPRRTLTGVLQDGSVFDRRWNPGGLWRPVRLELTGAVRIDRCRVLCRDANDTRAHLRITARLDSDEARSARVRTVVDGVVLAELDQPLARGENEIAWNLDVSKPQLWWPWSMGDQPLSDVVVEVLVDGRVSHRALRRTGFREIAMEDWVFSVNGERLFTKGINLAPSTIDLAGADGQVFRRDVELAREAGLDLVRCTGHVTRSELYDAADELGVLVWQDLPLRGTYARTVRRQAVEQARAAVDVLGHHPSIAVWCAHDAPEPTLLRQQAPTWNKTILDRWVKRALERADESRPALANSGVPPHLPQLEGSDSHLTFGWGRGDERDLAGFAAVMPRMVRFVGSFGSQSVPDDAAEWIDASHWPALDWPTLAGRYGADIEQFARHLPTEGHPSVDHWVRFTQRYQATVLRHHIETLRRLKYRPTGGFCLSSLADAAPRISTSVLDHLRRPKLAFAAITDACRPVIVVAERMPDQVTVGEPLALDVHAISDLHRVLTDVVCTATLRWPGGHHRWRWGGDVPPDECVRIGTVQFVVPDAPGGLWLDLSLEHGDEVATNRYEAIISR
jgi:beta-mannosidase